MEKGRDDQVVFVKDLLFAALYQWRKILAVAVALAVVLAGAVFAVQWRNSSQSVSEEAIQEAMENYENDKRLLDKDVEDAQKMVESQEAYNLESAFMALDPYGIYRAAVEVTVLTDSNVQYETADNTGAILHAYAVHLSSDQVIGAIAEKMELKSKYLTELIVMENGGNDTKSLSVTVSYPTAEGAQEILDTLLAAIQQAQIQITENLGEHRSSVLVSSVDERIDLTVVEKQKEAGVRLETLRTVYSEAKARRDALHAPSFDATISMKKVVLLAIVGAILGACAVAGCAWIGHIAGGKVYSARVLKNRTGVRVLGCIPAEGKKHPIDIFLRKLEGRSLGDDRLAVAVATARNYCMDGQKVLVTGDCDSADLELIAKELQKLGVSILACGNLLCDPEVLKELPQCDSVLLVEKCGYSKYTNVLLTMERIDDQNKQQLGCILLEG